MGVKHTFVSQVPDSADEDIVRPSNWNEDHTIDGDVDFNGHAIVNASKPYVIKGDNYTITANDFHVEINTANKTVTLDNTVNTYCHVDNSSTGLVYVTPVGIDNETLTLTPDEGSYFAYNGTYWRVK